MRSTYRALLSVLALTVLATIAVACSSLLQTPLAESAYAVDISSALLEGEATQSPDHFLPIVNGAGTSTNVPAPPTGPPTQPGTATATVVPNTPTASETPTPTPTPTPTSTTTNTSTATATAETPDSSTATPTMTPVSSIPLEDFEDAIAIWAVQRATAGSGAIVQSTQLAKSGNGAARLSTGGTAAHAYLHIAYHDPASAHQWAERPGTWRWQRAQVYVPAASMAQLDGEDSLTIAGMWPSASTSHGWWLQVREGGALWVAGFDANGSRREFPVYATLPGDRWVDIELGLHSQNGPGVKRAFAFLLDGMFYGWYHQGHMTNETYDRAAFGIVSSTLSTPVELFVDDWQIMTQGAFPGGNDYRSTAPVQEQDYRTQSGVQWQIDWSTWGANLRMDAVAGLYSATDRLQSGRNLDRMPALANGWAEMEIDWTNDEPPDDASTLPGAFAGMVGMRKEINREQNLEVILGIAAGEARIIYEAWIGDGPVVLASWTLPAATTVSGRNIDNIPEPGDLLRVRWQEVSATDLRVRADFFDQSTGVWHRDVIDSTNNLTSVGPAGVNYFDGFHLASSITIDTPFYSIRRFKLGTLETYPGE